MREVLSVSLGSPDRDFEVEIALGTHRLKVRRMGTGGSIDRALELLGQADGAVDAIGLGGVNRTYRLGSSSWPCSEGNILAAAAKKTPVVDGSGFKATFEKRVPELMRAAGMDCNRRNALVVSVLDRWGLASGLEKSGASVYAGDALTALSIPVIFPGLRFFSVAAHATMWALSRVPLARMYPLGENQDVRLPRFGWAFRSMDIVAGDFHFIRKWLPDRADGKWIITTTTTRADREWLKACGVSGLVTTSPALSGRSIGANIMDAIAVACAGCGRQLTEPEYESMWDSLSVSPSIESF